MSPVVGTARSGPKGPDGADQYESDARAHDAQPFPVRRRFRQGRFLPVEVACLHGALLGQPGGNAAVRCGVALLHAFVPMTYTVPLPATAPPPQVDYVALAPGQSVGRYEILAVLGPGGFGIPLPPRDTPLDRD